MKKEPQEIVGQLQKIRSSQPSVIANSLLMVLIQPLSFAGAVVLIANSIYIYYYEHNKIKDSQINGENDHLVHKSYLFLVIAVLLLLIWKLTRMVRNRNSYILNVNDILDGNKN